MAELLHVITYASLATLVVSVAARAVKFYRLPVHLRWELYPVAHDLERVGHGGSYLEQLNWWTKPRHTSLLGELLVMVPEMLLLKALWENNRALWFRSFPFHFGLYTLIGFGGLLVLGALAQLLGFPVSPAPDAGLVGMALYYLPILVGYGGLILTLLGAAALLHRRLANPDFRNYASPAHFFNLAIFLAAFGVTLLASLAADRDFALARGYLQSLLSLDLAAPVGSVVVGAEIVLVSLLIAYVPLTHMSHFFMKWFTWHTVRWDDEPNLRGSKLEAKIQELVKAPVTWSAPHLKADGRKNWVDIVTEEMK